MIVTLSQESSLLRGDVIKLNQHTLDSYRTTIELAGKHQRAVASCAQLLICVHLNISHTNSRARHRLHVIMYRHNIRFKTGSFAQFLGIVHGVLNSS
ncbi:hypothetical protein SNK04_011916 [Fusarium graminearum]